MILIFLKKIGQIIDILNEEPKERLKLNEFLDGSYNEEPTFNGTWISDTEISYINSNGDFVKYDINSENITVIIYARIMVCLISTKFFDQ